MFVSKLDFLRYLTNRIAGKDEVGVSTDFLREVITFFAAEEGAVYLFDSNDQLLPMALYPENMRGMRLSEDFSAYLASLKQVALFPDGVSHIDRKWQREVSELGFGAIALVPLLKQKQIIGFMSLAWKEPHSFKANDDNLLYTIGNLLGIGLFNAHLIGGLQVREDELQAMCRALMKAKEEEAKRISRELHDEVGQDLTTIILRLKMILGQKDVEDIHDDVKDLLFMARETLTDVQRIAMNLRPSALDNLGLLASVNWQLEQFRADNNIEVIFRHPHKLDDLTEEQELLLYRVLLEIMTNVSRHAQATKVVIDLWPEGDQLILRAGDNGIGIDLAGSHTMGLGLMGMKERIKEQNGAFRLNSEVGKGTTVMISIPIKKPEG
ncbi:histidine kinase [Desulfitobacterium hafniense]|uniref:Oxygen sensor histidine kinase NreB n=1 Tax=Desulfitobacterium hafniense TaxID=49338 RepID=A0A0W1JLE0_DESHA|nr:GAF domain-containing sensor histidine kinase [Desulfitobacterium hafniense]KTE92416.1 histidine kinase [Desulfitobacterium hafniense]